MEVFKYLLATCILMECWGCNAVTSANQNELKAEEIKQTVDMVMQWQFERHPTEDWNRSWQDATLFVGVVEVAATFRNKVYWEKARAWGEGNRWNIGNRTFHADDQAVGHAYLEMYRYYGEPLMIEDFRQSIDQLILQNIKGRELWWWCDALFMAPPAIARLAEVTGERRYLSLLESMYWDTYEFLYSFEHRLFFRDKSFFGKIDQVGNPIFWSRGNGWVVAGLVRILQALPQDYDAYNKYLNLYRDMMEKIVQVQPQNGLWRTNLLSPRIYPDPETSGSSFFCYALAWGINQGILKDDRYINSFERSWKDLLKHIDSNGKLGSVQPPGDRPGSVNKEHQEIYGTGAFLLAASEAYKMAIANEN